MVWFRRTDVYLHAFEIGVGRGGGGLCFWTKAFSSSIEKMVVGGERRIWRMHTTRPLIIGRAKFKSLLDLVAA